MKLIVFFLFVLCFQVRATGNAQQVTLTLKNVPLTQVFNEIEKQTGYHFFYKDKLLTGAPKTSVNVRNISVSDALNESIEQLPLTFSIVGKMIVIREKAINTRTEIVNPRAGDELFAEIKGVVRDQDGNPLQGVSVLVKGTTRGTSTRSDGSFSIEANKGDFLEFSMVGYGSVEFQIGNSNNIAIQLKQLGAASLEDVVVVGFGVQSKRTVTGSISSVDMDDMDKDQSSTFTQQLQGKVSGVNVQAATGMLGAMTRVNIRGVSSINASSEPLYVIDGIPIEENSVAGAGEPVSPFVNLNTDDIKSIDVLKGASAAAIYGTRGANGVIIITTKSGTANVQRINLRAEGGLSYVAKKLDLANTTEYLKIYNYIRKTNYNPGDFANTNWQDAISQTGTTQKYSFDISGGSPKSTYFISGNYDQVGGVILKNDMKKYGIRLKMTNKFNERLSVNFNLAPSVTELRSMGAHATINSGFGMAVLVPPTVPIFLPDGALNNERDPSAPANTIFNPFAGTPYTNLKNSFIDNDMKQILANLGGTYKILDNFSFTSNLNYRFFGSVGNQVYKNNTNTGYPVGQISASNRSFTNVSWNNILNYTTEWGKNSLELTLVSAIESTSRNFSNVSKTNVTDETLTDLDAASQVISGSGSTSSFRYQNNVARVNYNFDKKYLLTLSASYDGTSRFAQGQRYGLFPAAAAGWVLTDENFMKAIKPVNFLKLRLGFGVTGNANIGDFDYQPLLTSGIRYNNEPAIDFTQLANFKLTWETAQEFDLGFDFSLLKNRLSGALDYYRRTTHNLLLQRRVSNYNGFTTIFQNGGKMLNSGVEVNFDFKLVKTKVFQWNLNANFSSLHNEVLDLPGGDILGSTPNLIREGLPIASLFMPVYSGIDHETGDALFDNGKGGTTANYSEAPRQIVGSPLAKGFGGFGTNLSYKGFDFSTNFSYSYGNKLYWIRAEYMKGATSTYNQLRSVLDFWTPNNKGSDIPEPRLKPNGSNRSTRFVYDASYLRLNYIQIGYVFPRSLFGEKKTRLYFGGFNLFTITSFEGFDPAGDNSPRSNFSRGMIQGNDPLNINYNAGIQISF